MTVAETTIRRGLRAGLWLALGASVVELVQALVAILFTDWFIQYPKVEQIIQYGAIPVFIGLGLYFLFKKPSAPKVDWGGSATEFFKGITISSLNLLAIPYWIFYAGYLGADGWLKGHTEVGCFVLGVMVGSLLLLYLYARLSLKVLDRVGQVERWSNKLIGFIFLFFGAFQVLRILILG